MFSSDQNQQIEELVRAVEARTSGEVAVVWAQRSDDYAFVRGLWSLGLGSVLAAEVGAWAVQIPVLWLPGLTALVALGLYLVLGLGPILRSIAPGAVLSEAVLRRAQVAFLECGVTETTGRGGVLLFLSALEHRVHILADTGIAARVDQKVWQAVVDELTLSLRRRETMPGVARALCRIGDLLEQEFPRDASARNELGDAPRELR